MKHILFVAGILAARYDSEIHGVNIPGEAIEVSDETFFKTINEQDGIWKLIDGEIVKTELPFVEPVDPRTLIEVTAFQAHAAIARTGLYDDVTAIMEDANTPLEVKLAWNKAQSFKRLSPTVTMMAQALGLPEEQLDDLFALAATIEA